MDTTTEVDADSRTFSVWDDAGDTPNRVWATAILFCDNPQLVQFLAGQHGWRPLQSAAGFYLTRNRNLVWVCERPEEARGMRREVIFCARGRPPFVHRVRLMFGKVYSERELGEF